MKILNVVGARPNFMKIAPICRAFDSAIKANPQKKFEHILVHAGQHYDDNMSRVFFDELDIPKPDINLEIGSGTHSEQTAGIMVRFEKFCEKVSPDLILVVGDVNSTMACSIVGAKLLIPVAHVEAGLRSFDMTMPEEVNRVITDSISTEAFTTCVDANENLIREGFSEDRIHFVGNVMIDTLYHNIPKAEHSTIKTDIGLKEDEKYALVTLHRPSNVDDEAVFTNILTALKKVSDKIKVIFPVHPRTCKRIEASGIYDEISGHRSFQLLDPVGYLDFLNLMKDAAIVLTDSGGIQEETTVLGIPCLTLRKNTERPVTVKEGTNILVGLDMEMMIAETDKILNGNGKVGKIPELWDGKAAERIAADIFDIYC